MGSSKSRRFFSLRCFWTALLSLGALGGCQGASLSSDQLLRVLMTGAFERSPDAGGNAEPSRIDFTLTGVSLRTAAGELTDLRDGAEPQTYRVINRPQIVFEGQIGDYVGETFSGLVVTFDPTIVAMGQTGTDLTARMANPSASFFETLSVTKGKSITVTIHVQWRDLITRDADASPVTEKVTAPSLRFELDNTE